MTTSANVVKLGEGLQDFGSDPFSLTPYYSDSFYEREKRLWRDSWIALGRVDDFNKPGDYITFDLKVIHASIVVVLGRDGKLRGFHNVCSHRSGRLARDESCRGNANSFVCKFHGWAYDLDGKLRGLPEHHLFEGLPKDQLGLKPVSVDTWGGFVFANLSPAPEFTLQDWFHGVPDNLDGYLGKQNWVWYAGYERVIRANWKDLMNAQHDGYHAQTLHSMSLPGAQFFSHDSIRNSVFPQSPGVCSLLSVYQPMVSSDKDPLAEMTTVQRLSMQFGSSSNWVLKDASVAAAQFPGAVNPLETERWVFDCWTFFPNLLLFVGKEVLVVMRVWPLSAHEADWEWDWYYKGETSDFGDLFNREHGKIQTRNALTEDWPMAESAHENFRSGVMDNTYCGMDMEATVRALHEKLLQRLNIAEEDLNEYA